ncbi:hypothetical protein K7X08_023017 [Anisodus acutangulus]|uniref:Ubiquitin-like protease family profile domain-containing protein n=1 Tax=Anisodus acutangulus TaxID=402998 RepID=A0A9Q1MC59_9SOLA|nr:hypothetical protein K7X08_023017 [Anisodus acutangulus]
MEVEEKDVTPEKLGREISNKINPISICGRFDSRTSKPIFYIKHSFMSDIDKYYPLSPLAQEFIKFIEDGLNMTRRVKILYRDGKMISLKILFLARVMWIRRIDLRHLHIVNDKLVMKALLPYKILIPYFLEKSKFNSKRAIDKSRSDALEINLVDKLTQQTNSDCGVFVVVFADYFVHDKEIKTLRYIAPGFDFVVNSDVYEVLKERDGRQQRSLIPK